MIVVVRRSSRDGTAFVTKKRMASRSPSGGGSLSTVIFHRLIHSTSSRLTEIPTSSVTGELKKWRPAGADRGFTFLQCNLTITYHRTNLLARYGGRLMLMALGFKEGYRVDVDIPESSWAKAPSFHDILILNTVHWWWAPAKFDPLKSPMLFFEGGRPILPPISPAAGLDQVLSNMACKLKFGDAKGALLDTEFAMPEITLSKYCFDKARY